jgi:hypothetical protein
VAFARAWQEPDAEDLNHRRKLEHGRKNNDNVVLKVAGISKRFGGLQALSMWASPSSAVRSMA